jgi:hypothetical protein
VACKHAELERLLALRPPDSTRKGGEDQGAEEIRGAKWRGGLTRLGEGVGDGKWGTAGRQERSEGGGDVVEERPHSGEVKVVCRALSQKKCLGFSKHMMSIFKNT